MFDTYSSKLQIENKTNKIVTNFFDQLVLNDYLKDTEPYRSITGLALRNGRLLRMFDTLEIDIDNSSSDLLKFVRDHGLEDYDYYVLYYTLIVHLWLDQIELMRSMILTMLNKKAKDECNICDNDALGTLLSKLDQKFPTTDFRKLTDVDFRNILGHGKWWVQMENFCYEDKNKKIHFLEKNEFLIKQLQFVALTIKFGDALKSYFV